MCKLLKKSFGPLISLQVIIFKQYTFCDLTVICHLMCIEYHVMYILNVIIKFISLFCNNEKIKTEVKPYMNLSLEIVIKYKQRKIK